MRSIAEIIKLALAGAEKAIELGRSVERRAAANTLIGERVGEMTLQLGYQPEVARKIVLKNIGYYAGYLDEETADKVMDLFNTEHPYFGRKHYTPEEILKMGYELGRKMKEEKENDGLPPLPQKPG